VAPLAQWLGHKRGAGIHADIEARARNGNYVQTAPARAVVSALTIEPAEQA
jgi:hypothetical protein